MPYGCDSLTARHPQYGMFIEQLNKVGSRVDTLNTNETWLRPAPTPSKSPPLAMAQPLASPQPVLVP